MDNTIKIISNLTFIMLLFRLTSCRSSEDSNIVAKVFDKNLELEELLNMMPKDIHGKDSISMAKTIIDGWIEKNVVLHQAENNLSNEEKDVSLQLEDYRMSIITYKYENALINEKLDTAVSSQEITKYYKDHSRNFELKDNIIKVWYIKLKKNSNAVSKIKLLYKYTTEKNKKQLENLCVSQAENYYLKEDSWLLFDELLKEIPIKTYDKEQYLQNNRYIEFTDDGYLYLVNIIDFKIKDSISPIAFETNNIRNIILSKRKLDLIENMKKDVLTEAKNNKDIVTY